MGRIDTYPQSAILQPNSPITLAYAEVTSIQSGITAETDITGLSVNVSVPEGRRIRISWMGTVRASVAADVSQIAIKEDNVSVQRIKIYNGVNSGVDQQSAYADVIRTPTAGLHNYKIALSRSTGTGTQEHVATASSPAFILVEDITGMPTPIAPASVPVGVLAQAQNFGSGQTSASATLVDLTGSNLTVVVPSGRLLRLSAKMHGSSTVAGDRYRFLIMEGATPLNGGYRVVGGGSTGEELFVEAYISPSAGSHTYKCAFARDVGSGTVTVYSNASDEVTFFVIEDITATPAATTGAPSSTLAYAESQADSGTITTNANITGLTNTITVPAGRRLRVSFKGEVRGTTGDVWVFAINEGATTLQRQTGKLVGTASESVEIAVVLSPSAGSHTYVINLGLSSGTGVIFGAAPTYPGFIMTEDITASTYTYSQPGVLPVNSTSLPSNPSTGAMVYEIDTGATRIWTGSAWQLFGSGGNLTLGYAQITANQTGITTEVDITGLSLTVTVPAGRRLRVSSYVQPFSTVAADTFLGRIYQDGVQVQQGLVGLPLTGTGYSLDVSVELTPSAGTHVYKYTGFRNNGSGSLSVFAAANTPSFILVEDITGNVPPSPAISVPVGQLAYAATTTQQTGITTVADLTGLSVNVTVPAGRVLRITAQTYLFTSVTNDEITMQINEGATALSFVPATAPLGGRGWYQTNTVIISPSAGNHVYKLQGGRSAGTGSITNNSQAGEPSFIMVEDITPTPAAASGAPSSTLAYAEVTVDQGSITAETDLTSLAVTLTVPAGRRIRITGHALFSSTQVDEATGFIKEGSSYLGRFAKISLPIIGNLYLGEGSVTISPSAGSHTYKLAALRTGTGTVSMNADAGGAGTRGPAFILVEDVTGSVWPAGSQVTSGIIASEAWVDYSPSNTNITIGNGTQIAKYIKFGRTVFIRYVLTWGSTTSYGGSVSIGLPFAAVGVGANIQPQSLATTLLDSSARFYIGVAYTNETDNTHAGIMQTTGAANATGRVDATSPFTWTVGDQIVVTGCYESAT